jgi:hypothetical protein
MTTKTCHRRIIWNGCQHDNNHKTEKRLVDLENVTVEILKNNKVSFSSLVIIKLMSIQKHPHVPNIYSHYGDSKQSIGLASICVY